MKLTLFVEIVDVYWKTYEMHKYTVSGKFTFGGYYICYFTLMS
jgi:hypothetical protein